MAYERVAGPLGPARADLQAAIIASTVANAAAGKPRFVPSDYIPRWDRPAVQPWEEQLAAVKALNAALGGTDLTEGGVRGDPVQPARANRGRRERRAARR